MLIAADGDYAGTISGGCLEDEVAQEALRVLADGKAVRRSIDTRPHYGCPGQLEIFIEALPEAWLDGVAERMRRRKVFTVRTVFEVASDQTTGSVVVDTAGGCGGEETGCFHEDVKPQMRVVVVSGTSDAEPLLQMAKLLGWEARRIRPAGEAERAGANDEGAEVCAAGELAGRYPPDERTAVVIMTHHLARDLEYLRAVVPATYPYIGLLGSRRRRESLLAELGEAGLLEDETIEERLHAPVGLDLGAEDPAAIALAIAAEIQARFHGAGGGSLRARRGAIHVAGGRTAQGSGA